MYFQAFVLPVPALLGIACLLTNYPPVQKFADRCLQIQITCGQVTLRIGYLFLLFNVTALASEVAFMLHRQAKLTDYLERISTGDGFASSEMEDVLRTNVWRAERNFWIGILGVLCWLAFLRMNCVISLLKGKIIKLNKQSQAGTSRSPAIIGAEKDSTMPSRETAVERETTAEKRQN